MNFKKLLSYLYPIKEFETPSEINKNIEVTWNNGKLVLDSKNTNFSYGSLEKVMRIGLKNIGFKKINKYKSALILGVAGGSVIKLLRNEFNFNEEIIGVEIDHEIIKVANEYFKINKTSNFTLIEEDAEKYVHSSKENYDLIIVDIFQDKLMPDFLFNEPFVGNLTRILSEKGTILFNSIVTLSTEFERNLDFEKTCKKYFSEVIKISQVEGNNELFILSK